jgi:hypothetical protein
MEVDGDGEAQQVMTGPDFDELLQTLDTAQAAGAGTDAVGESTVEMEAFPLPQLAARERAFAARVRDDYGDDVDLHALPCPLCRFETSGTPSGATRALIMREIHDIFYRNRGRMAPNVLFAIIAEQYNAAVVQQHAVWFPNDPNRPPELRPSLVELHYREHVTDARTMLEDDIAILDATIKSVARKGILVGPRGEPENAHVDRAAVATLTTLMRARKEHLALDRMLRKEEADMPRAAVPVRGGAAVGSGAAPTELPFASTFTYSLEGTEA